MEKTGILHYVQYNYGGTFECQRIFGRVPPVGFMFQNY